MEYITNTGFSEDIIFPDELRKAPRRKGDTQVLLLFYTSISIPQVSRKTILNNGGVYESAVCEPDEKVELERYWITL